MKNSITFLLRFIMVLISALVLTTIVCASELDGELEFFVDESAEECTVVGIGTYIGNEIIIPESYKGYPVTRIEEKAFYDNMDITKLVVPDSVKSIGEYAFHYCISLESVTLGNGVQTIENSAFYFCTQLEELDLGQSVKIIERYAFYNCTDLDYLTIPDSVETVGEAAFKYCDNLIQLHLGQGVESIESSAFEFCYKLLELYNFSKIDIVAGSEENGFVGAYLMTLHTSENEPSVLIPKQDKYVFANIGGTYMLVSQTGDETELTFPSDVDGNKYIIYKLAFNNRTSLKSVDFGTGVTAIARAAFNMCGSLESIEINEGVTQIGSLAFNNCHSLKKVSLPETVTSIGVAAFQNCYVLQGIKLPSGISVIEEKTFLHCYNIKYVIFSQSITKIGTAAFSDCDALTDMTIPGGVESIGQYAFLGCDALVRIYIHKNVSAISEYAFYDCPKLTIYCEAESAPDGWSANWNGANRPVEWGTVLSLDSIFVFLGYSTNGTNVCAGYSVDKNMFELCRSSSEVTIEFGVVFASYELLQGANPLDELCRPITLDTGKIVKLNLSNEDYVTYNLILADLTSELYSHRFVISGYVFDGTTVSYVQGENKGEITGVSYNDIMEELESAGAENGISVAPL